MMLTLLQTWPKTSELQNCNGPPGHIHIGVSWMQISIWTIRIRGIKSLNMHLTFKNITSKRQFNDFTRPDNFHTASPDVLIQLILVHCGEKICFLLIKSAKIVNAHGEDSESEVFSDH